MCVFKGSAKKIFGLGGLH